MLKRYSRNVCFLTTKTKHGDSDRCVSLTQHDHQSRKIHRILSSFRHVDYAVLLSFTKKI